MTTANFTTHDTSIATATGLRWRRTIDELADTKAGETIAVCIPARNEAATVAGVVAPVAKLHELGFVDELVVVDDASTDGTAAIAAAAGATVVAGRGRGKGAALRAALQRTSADIVVFLDADVTTPVDTHVPALVAPLLADASVQLVKPTYRRPLDGRPDEGGRVTELVARPLLRRYFPDLAAAISQPLAGETALRRAALDGTSLEDGYRIEIALLLFVYARFGLHAIREVDLGERAHRNRPLRELTVCAEDVLAAVLDRIAPPSVYVETSSSPADRSQMEGAA